MYGYSSQEDKNVDGYYVTGAAVNNENNPDADSGVKYFDNIAEANFDSRASFILKVYVILCVQLAVTCAVSCAMWFGTPGLRDTSSSKGKVPDWFVPTFYATLACQLAVMLMLCCCSNYFRRAPQSYIFLSFFTLVMSAVVGFGVCAHQAEDVLLSAGITAGIFLFLTVFAMVVKTDFTGCGPYLFAALFILLCFSLIVSLLQPVAYMSGGSIYWLRVCINVAVVIIFSFYLIYDTQLILGGRSYELSTEDFVFAAIMLYLDVINIFLALLSLIGNE